MGAAGAAATLVAAAVTRQRRTTVAAAPTLRAVARTMPAGVPIMRVAATRATGRVTPMPAGTPVGTRAMRPTAVIAAATRDTAVATVTVATEVVTATAATAAG